MKGYLLKTDKIETINSRYEQFRFVTLPQHMPMVYDGSEPAEAIEYNEEIIDPLFLCYMKHTIVEKRNYYIQDEWVRDYIETIKNDNHYLGEVKKKNERDLKILIDQSDRYESRVKKYNNLPWYKKLFRGDI